MRANRCCGTPAGLLSQPRQDTAPRRHSLPGRGRAPGGALRFKEAHLYASSRRVAPLPPHWTRLRRAVMNRDAWRCQHVRYDTGELCGEPARHCDHIVPASEGGSDDPANLRALCDWHVLRKDSADAGRARRRATADRWQPARNRRRHPGEVR